MQTTVESRILLRLWRESTFMMESARFCKMYAARISPLFWAVLFSQLFVLFYILRNGEQVPSVYLWWRAGVIITCENPLFICDSPFNQFSNRSSIADHMNIGLPLKATFSFWWCKSNIYNILKVLVQNSCALQNCEEKAPNEIFSFNG